MHSYSFDDTTIFPLLSIFKIVMRCYKYTLISLLACVSLMASAQEYCVIAFSEKRQDAGKFLEKPLEPLVSEYLWIIPMDSLLRASGNVTIYPFVIDPLDDYSESGWYSYYWRDMIEYPSKTNEERLYRIIREHRIKLQEYSYTQIFGPKQKTYRTEVKVYVTPIVGVCNSVISSFDNRRVFYSKEFEYQDNSVLSDSFLAQLQSYPLFRIPYKVELSDNQLLTEETIRQRQ